MQANAGGPHSSTVSVLLINMSSIFRDLLISALTMDSTISVAACMGGLKDLQESLAEQWPDVALIGVLGLGREASALPFLERLSVFAPKTRAIVIAPEMGQEDVVSLFQHGARGLLCASGTDLSLLTKCLHCVASGQIWASAVQLETLVCSLSAPRTYRVTNVLGEPLLSKREEQVLHHLADGMSNRELASTLKLSEHTVKNHLFRIFDKLGVSNRMEAVLYVMSQREQRVRSAASRPNALAEKIEPGAVEGQQDRQQHQLAG